MNNNSYSVFCVASILLRHDSDYYNELDRCWDKARELCEEFNNSKFNNRNQSELDGINAFMESKDYLTNNPGLCLTIHRRSSFVWSEEDVDLQADGHPNQELVENMSNSDKLNLLEHAIDQAEDDLMAMINQSICNAISELSNP